jgi:hypothetical protein
MVFLSSVCLARARAESAPGQVSASDWAVQQSELCMAALRQAEQRYHLPPALLVSIAKAESGRPITAVADIRPWPWTIDADGTGLFLDSKAAVIAWMHELESRHHFIDGKSTMLGVAREAWEADGYQVRGAALFGGLSALHSEVIQLHRKRTNWPWYACADKEIGADNRRGLE